MGLVAHDNRGLTALETHKTQCSLLQQGALAHKREELLGHVLSRKGPEPAARTAGKDHGLKAHPLLLTISAAGFMAVSVYSIAANGDIAASMLVGRVYD